MNKPDQAQIRENLRIADIDNEGQLPEGAVIEFFDDCDEWDRADAVNCPQEYIYRITLPKPSPHPTLLSIVEHGCFPQDWAEWFAVDSTGAVCACASKPVVSAIVWRFNSRHYLLFNLHTSQPNWAQQCWTLDELRDIIKRNNENAAQQGSITQNAVELSEAEQFCYDCHCDMVHMAQMGKIRSQCAWDIGKRIAAQRKGTQS